MTYVEVSGFQNSSQPQSPHNMSCQTLATACTLFFMHTRLHCCICPYSLSEAFFEQPSLFGSSGCSGKSNTAILKRACSLTGWLYMRSTLHYVFIPPFGSTSMACRSRRTMSNGLLRRGIDFLRIITCRLLIGRSRISSQQIFLTVNLSQSLIDDVERS